MSRSVIVPLARRSSPYRTNPFGDFDRVFNNLFHNALANHGAAAPSNAGDLPVRMNVSETETSYAIAAELPGLDEKQIELTVNDGMLTLQGEKHAEDTVEGKTFHRVEHHYGSFKRVLQLPADADENSVSAKMRNGVLEISIAKLKQPEKSVKRIDITNG